MDDAQNTSMGVLVKRPDGTTVRVSLSELKKRAAQKQQSISVQDEEDQADEVVQEEEKIAEEKSVDINEIENVEENIQDSVVTPVHEEPVRIEPIPEPVMAETVVEKVEPQLEQIPQPILPEPTPYVPDIKTVAPQQSSKKEDTSSLLEEQMHATEIRQDEVVTYDYGRLVDQIMQDAPIVIPPQVQMRARQFIMSLVRGIRDKHQFHEIAIRTKEDGGLGLTDEDAARLVAVVMDKKHDTEKALKQEHKQILKTTVETMQKKNASDSLDISTKNIVAQQSKPAEYGSLVTTTPVPHYFEDVAKSKIASKQNKRSSIPLTTVKHTVRPPTPPQRLMGEATAFTPQMTQIQQAQVVAQRPPIPQAPRTASRTMRNNMMQDMHVPQQELRTMGPVEEMEKFDLIDLRRLSNDPMRAAEKVIEKLQGWKQESYLLYMDARAGWFRSPLYKRYQTIIQEAINQKITVEAYLRDHDPKNELTIQEIHAIVEVHRQLKV